MTPAERVGALVIAVRYLDAAGIRGSIAECGVWRGGSVMAAALTLMSLGDTERDIYLYDTWDRMPPPSDRDVDVWGRPAARLFTGPESANEISELANVGRAETERVVKSIGYPAERLYFVEGLVEDTLPLHAPNEIALLRLDTDWYQSTRHEMEHLFPRIVDGGVLLIDDYGLFQGAKDAVDEYLDKHGIHLLLNRTDFAGRIAIVRASGGRSAVV
jgi:hypothetical protein